MAMKDDVLMRNRSRLPEAVYGRDPDQLGHWFFAVTGNTDQCDNCGCKVGPTNNWPGFSGGSFNHPCKEQTWRCDECRAHKPAGSPAYPIPDHSHQLCGECARREIAANA